MEQILDKNGKVICKSRNLAGISRYVGKHIVKSVSIQKLPEGKGKLFILFEDGSSYESIWGHFYSLCLHLKNWRNLYGSYFEANGEHCGVISNTNYALVHYFTFFKK